MPRFVARVKGVDTRPNGGTHTASLFAPRRRRHIFASDAAPNSADNLLTGGEAGPAMYIGLSSVIARVRPGEQEMSTVAPTCDARDHCIREALSFIDRQLELVEVLALGTHARRTTAIALLASRDGLAALIEAELLLAKLALGH